MEIKIKSPAGYQVNDIYNDNIDLNVVFEDGKVFFGTFFTPQNAQLLIERDNYLWATNMVLVKNLTKENIRKAILSLIEDDCFENAFALIGTIDTIYEGQYDFSSLKEW